MSTKIYDELDNEIQESDIDLELGYTVPEQKFIKHHEAIEEQEAVTHFECRTFYFEDDTQLDVSELGNEDPHVQIVDDKAGVFNYVDQGEGKIYRGLDLEEITDKEKVEAKEAWDEYEDILRYKLYTQEELDQRKAQQEYAEMEALRAQQMQAVAQMFVAAYTPTMLDEDLYSVSTLLPTWTLGESYKPKDVVQYEDSLYRCLQNTTARSEFAPDKAVSLWKKIEKADPETGIYPWSQPLGSTDAYMRGDQVSYEGKIYESTIDHNVWAPTVFGWSEVKDATVEPEPEVPETETYPEFKQPTGGHDAYKKGDRVIFEGKVYESLIDANVYSPTVYPAGWKEIQE